MYNASVLPVLIASPSDVAEERTVASDVVYEINYTDSFQNNLVLLPVGWETHSSPEFGHAPQDQINERLVDRCDIVVGVFWTKVGTPTKNEISGTVEEIKRHHSSGKPVLLYFSERPVAPEMLDAKQYSKLKAFKKWCQPQGLYQPFSSSQDLRKKLSRQLRLTLNDNQYLKTELVRFREIADQQSQSFQTVSFPKIAIELLRGASEGRGMILVRDHLGGSSISAGNHCLETSGSGREDAEARSAINSLVEYGLIEERSFGSGIYYVTNEGYEANEQGKP